MSETKMTYTDWYNQSKQRADQDYQSAVDLAQINYQKSQSEYGSRAAALESMGLTGGGYSDYLNGKAYAEMQGAIANANAQKAQTLYNLDTSYMQYLENKDAENKNAYNNLYSSIINNPSAYTVTDISNLGSLNGLTADQITQLKNAFAQKLVSSGNYGVEDLKSIYGEGTDLYNTYYQKLVDEAKTFDKNSFYDSEGKLISKTTAQGIINDAKNLGVDTGTLQNAFDELYTVKTVGATFNKDGGNDKPGEAGNNMSVKIGDEIYRVQYSGAEVSEEAKQSGLSLDEGTVFKYNGNLYVKRNGSIYAIGARPMWQGHWDALFAKFNDTKTE